MKSDADRSDRSGPLEDSSAPRHGDEPGSDEPGGRDAVAGPRGWRRRAGERRAAAVERLTPWPQANRFATRALLALLIAGVLAGPIALLRSYATSSEATAPVARVDSGASQADARARARVQATGAASSLVWAWLSAGQSDADTLEALLAYPPAQLSLPRDRPSPPTSVTVLDATGSETSWTVTVGARGGAAGNGATYRVAVRVDEQGATPLTLPGQIPAPVGRTAERGGDDDPAQVNLSTGNPAATAASGFVQTLLSGTGDLSRWTSPGSALAAVRPATCSTAQTATSAATDPPEPTDGETVEVLTTATCRHTAGRTSTVQTLQYLLTLTARGGRWEVSAYTGAPAAAASSRPSATSTEPAKPTGPDPSATPVPNSPLATTPTSATPR